MGEVTNKNVCKLLILRGGFAQKSATEQKREGRTVLASSRTEEVSAVEDTRSDKVQSFIPSRIQDIAVQKAHRAKFRVP
jgi:hypothetical protein